MIAHSPLLHVPTEFALKGHPVWDELAGYFDVTEFRDPYAMDVGFLRLLLRIRKRADCIMRLSSDARNPKGDVGADKSAHKKRPCRAVDGVAKNSFELGSIIFAAVLEGIVRVGIYAGNVWHIDAETHPENPSPRIWTTW